MAEWEFVAGNSVVNRYVSALFEVAAKKNSQKQIAVQLTAVKDFIVSQKNYKKLLQRISFISSDGIKLIQFIKSHVRLSTEISNFLDLLLNNGRLGMILDICDAYSARLDHIEGKKIFYVTLANKSSEYSVDKLKEELVSVFGGKIECVTKFDPAIKDGFKLQYKSKVLDYSLKSRLRRLRAAMRRENYEN